MEKTIALGSIYELQGLKPQALKIYKSVLEKDPNNKEALLGCKRLSDSTSKPKIPPKAPAQLQRYAPLQRFEIQKMQNLFVQADKPAELRTIEEWLMQWN
ncbi:hypothetical protein ACFOPX_04230 [Helicobacter baculiformis]|uniref:Tetratricopeptide repeat protein n=1 Tax=Helicobacter baculiformis TaxID=427351 RepID=A0ABV7ZKP3_9HELI|nr:tetratricopeptide repeat protein [Helicobacter baculiformis]